MKKFGFGSSFRINNNKYYLQLLTNNDFKNEIRTTFHYQVFLPKLHFSNWKKFVRGGRRVDTSSTLSPFGTPCVLWKLCIRFIFESYFVGFYYITVYLVTTTPYYKYIKKKEQIFELEFVGKTYMRASRGAVVLGQIIANSIMHYDTTYDVAQGIVFATSR